MLIDREILDAIESGDLQIATLGQDGQQVPDTSYLSRIQPASLDVRLGNTFAVWVRNRSGEVDPKKDHSADWRFDTVEDDGSYSVHPGEMVLAATKEHIGLPDDLLARVEGKSSLGRLGLLVHATAGFVDPGWPLAPITLELSTVINVPLRLYPGMPIAQLCFQRVSPVASGYSGKYVGQGAPATSQYHQNWVGRWI